MFNCLLLFVFKGLKCQNGLFRSRGSFGHRQAGREGGLQRKGGQTQMLHRRPQG
jgi:hypothetical protein